MGNVKFNLENKKVLDSMLLEISGVVPGKMFGYPAYYVKKKLFACVYEEGVGLKVPEKIAKELVGKDGIIHFQPLGRPKMREWIQINHVRSEDYLNDKDIFDISINYISSLIK